jgi:hypothetical protein
MVDGATNNSETASVQLLPQCQGFKSPVVIGDYTQWSIEDVSCFPFDLSSRVIHRTGFPAFSNSRFKTKPALTLRVALKFWPKDTGFDALVFCSGVEHQGR